MNDENMSHGKRFSTLLLAKPRSNFVEGTEFMQQQKKGEKKMNEHKLKIQKFLIYKTPPPIQTSYGLKQPYTWSLHSSSDTANNAANIMMKMIDDPNVDRMAVNFNNNGLVELIDLESIHIHFLNINNVEKVPNL